jgi:tetratricopeptide (TPR) repeat protein
MKQLYRRILPFVVASLVVVPVRPEEDPTASALALPEPLAALRRGLYEEAAEGFRAALRADPGAVSATRGLAESLAARGLYDEALAALAESPKRSESAALLCAAGRIHLARGALKPAEEAFRAACGIDPRSPEALNRLGETLARFGRKEEARASWEKVVQLYDAMSYEEAGRSSAEAFVEMGLSLIGLNRYKEANDVMFAQAKEKDESCPAVLLESARALMDKYNYPDSRMELRSATDQNPFFADALVLLADNLLADFQRGTNRYELVEKYLERALKVNVRHARAHTVRGALWLTDGNVGRAAEDFRKAVALDPSSLEARGYLAACHYLDADEEALRSAEREALEVNAKGALFFHTIALAIEKKFRYADAVRYSDRALEADPEYWPAYVTLAINCLRTGDEGRGRELLEKSWKHDPFNVWVYNTRLLLKHMDAHYRELRTDRFVFKFPKEDYEVLATYLVPFMEKAYEKLPDHYGVELPRPIYVEAFSEHKWFSARTVGLEGLAASGACFGRLVTLATPKALPMNWGAVAWHEFAHVVTLALSRQRVPRWLTEGCSVFEEGRDHPRWARVFEREIADAYGSGRLLPLAELDFGFSKPKYPNQILVSYFQGCLVVRYIAEKWGFDAVLRMLEGYGENQTTVEVFRAVLGSSLEEFDAGFFAYVDSWVKGNGYEPTIVEDRIPALEAAVDEHPGEVERLVDLAWAYHSNRVRIDVPLTVEKVLRIDPSNGDAHAILGLEYLALKKEDDAREPLEKALAEGTRFRFRVHSALADIARKKGEKALAIEHLEKAKAIAPRACGGAVYFSLAELYGEADRKEDAVRQMEELSAHSPEDARSRKAIVDHYGEKDDEESARKTFQALDELLYINPFVKPETHERLARLAARLGEHETVLREYRRLLELSAGDAKEAYLGLAKACASLGRAAEAEGWAKKLLEVDSTNAEAQRILDALREPRSAIE